MWLYFSTPADSPSGTTVGAVFCRGLSEGKARRELDFPGVYFLFGDGEATSHSPRAAIRVSRSVRFG